MKVVYIAHPLSAPTPEEIHENRRRASLWAAWAAVTQGVSPSCSWIVLTGVLPETPENRERGLACDLAHVERCDELWLVGGKPPTAGMRLEAEHARKWKIPVYDLTHLGELPPWPLPRDTEAAPPPAGWESPPNQKCSECGRESEPNWPIHAIGCSRA